MTTAPMPTKAEFKFDCPACGQHILVAKQWSGLGISCPSCQSRITIPAPSADEQSPPPATSPKYTGRTIRIELPGKTNQATLGRNGQAADSKVASVDSPAVDGIENSQSILGNEPWPEVVRRLEKGTLVAPAELVTALFHELMAVRRRLDKVETKIAQDRPARTDGALRRAEEVQVQSPNRLGAARVNSGGNGSGD